MTRRAAKAAILLIDEIAVGPRHRRELGDIEGLAASMGNLDMLEPIVVRPDDRGQYQLVCGARRLAAAKQLGQTKVSVIVRNLTEAEALKAEFAENVFRKDFTLSEAVAIKRELEPIERAAAKERQGGRTDKHPGKLPASSTGRAADKAAKATGMARRTLEKAEAIVDAAEAEPEKFGKLLADMDRTGRVNGVFKRLKVAQAGRSEYAPNRRRCRATGPIASSSPIRRGPTRFAHEDPSHRAELALSADVASMRLRKLEVRSIAQPDSILWLWVTNHHMLKASKACARCLGVQAKDDADVGQDDNLGPATGCAGKPSTASWPCAASPSSAHKPNTVLHRAVRGHSQKPPSSTISSRSSARRRATPICSRATGITTSGIATAMKRRRSPSSRPRNNPSP